jgi:hypothetical protein
VRTRSDLLGSNLQTAEHEAMENLAIALDAST